MALVVYGIPNCDTVKKARSWLTARGLSHSFVDIRATPPDRATTDRWVAAFGATALKNTSGGSYRALGAAKDGWDEARWAEAYASDPMLIKRPVVERDGEPALVGWNHPEDELTKRLA